MDLADYVGVLRRGWVVILVCGLFGALGTGVYAATATPQYRSTASVFFSVSGGDSVTQLLQGSTFSQNQVRSYALLAKKPAVLEPVIEELDLDITPRALAGQIDAQAPADTVLLDISVTSGDPQRAADIANAVAAQLGSLVAELSSSRTGEGGLEVQATTVASAEPPGYAFSPNTRRLLLIGLLLGAVVGVVLVLLREVLNVKVRSEEDVHQVTDTPVLGTVGHEPGASKKPILQGNDRGPRAEAFRRIAANLEFLNVDGAVKSLVITSPLPGEGKSTTAVNLALTMSEGRRVLLIDADLRSPSIADMLGLTGAIGLSNVLSGSVTPRAAIQPWGRGRFDVLTAGSTAPNPGELLGSAALLELLQRTQESYDLVIVDTAPVLPVSDSAVVARACDGALIVANARKTTRGQLTECLKNFSRSGARALGILVNQAKVRSVSYYGAYGAPQPTGSRSSKPTRPGPVRPPAQRT